MNHMREYVYNLLSLEKVYYLTYGRDIIIQWCGDFININQKKKLNVLDIGCGNGTDLLNIKSTYSNTEMDLYGIESYGPNVEQAKKNSITVFSIDMERESIPVEAGSFDIIIMNQFLEHTKEIFWIFSEISRVVAKEGIVIVGVPNLAVWTNRLFLLVGTQPNSIELMGPHVRGFTAPNFKKFIETDGYFKVSKIAGSNFFPFPYAPICKFFSKILPTLSVGLFFLIKRDNKGGEFIHVLDNRFFETPYFQGKELD
jgi:ubiquinone/menaquinone biosynthesis C-methylase UbiE